jgi:hypothetical protein
MAGLPMKFQNALVLCAQLVVEKVVDRAERTECNAKIIVERGSSDSVSVVIHGTPKE